MPLAGPSARSPTRSIMRPANACATCRSHWTSCWADFLGAGIGPHQRARAKPASGGHRCFRGASLSSSMSVATTAVRWARPNALARAAGTGLLNLHGSVGSAGLDRHHRQVPALAADFCRWVDDLADRSDSVDDLCAGGIGDKVSDRLDLPGAVPLGRQREHIWFARLKTDDRRLREA